jgi:hypothetical protein
VELNINALGEVFSLDSATMKDVVGSLNWKKLAERIRTQLNENQLLTQNQRRVMHLNSIICLIKSNCIEEARDLLANLADTSSDPRLS